MSDGVNSYHVWGADGCLIAFRGEEKNGFSRAALGGFRQYLEQTYLLTVESPYKGYTEKNGPDPWPA